MIVSVSIVLALSSLFSTGGTQGSGIGSLSSIDEVSDSGSFVSSTEDIFPANCRDASYFTVYLQRAAVKNWVSSNVSTTDFDTCYLLNPDFAPQTSTGLFSRFRNQLSRDNQPGIKNLMFAFEEGAKPPDISIRIFRNAPVLSGQTAQATCSKGTALLKPRVLNILDWMDLTEQERKDWLRPRWWERSYFRLKETDSFQVLRPGRGAEQRNEEQALANDIQGLGVDFD
ncbi:hypothetical protein ABW19_dt0205694 [Dactylella cylindrospora]|nr:hypothetical protein ABW19_dt0205694 [Dactylella cylindrospora]